MDKLDARTAPSGLEEDHAAEDPAGSRGHDEAEHEGRTSARAGAADRHVGARIRERRVMLGLSQQQLAQMIGVTYQQAHKYERGLNRISAGRLYEIAQVLGVPVSWFFEGLATEGHAVEMTPRQRMCLELARNFAAIDNEKHQEALSQMARALAAQSARGGHGSEPE
jgi:transcriptional regulator with XRE-family HTH domain